MLARASLALTLLAGITLLSSFSVSVFALFLATALADFLRSWSNYLMAALLLAIFLFFNASNNIVDFIVTCGQLTFSLALLLLARTSKGPYSSMMPHVSLVISLNCILPHAAEAIEICQSVWSMLMKHAKFWFAAQMHFVPFDSN